MPRNMCTSCGGGWSKRRTEALWWRYANAGRTVRRWQCVGPRWMQFRVSCGVCLVLCWWQSRACWYLLSDATWRQEARERENLFPLPKTFDRWPLLGCATICMLCQIWSLLTVENVTLQSLPIDHPDRTVSLITTHFSIAAKPKSYINLHCKFCRIVHVWIACTIVLCQW